MEALNYIAKDEKFKIVKINKTTYPNYLISNYGRVYSLVHKKFLKPFKDHRGYLQFYLYKNGKRKHVSGHRLVGFAFVKNPNGYKILNHKDQSRDNNRWTNLEWCTNQYNITYGDAQQRRIAHIIKPVIQMDKNKNIIAEYPSIAEAGRKAKFATSSIFVACRYGKLRKECYWSYKEAC